MLTTFTALFTNASMLLCTADGGSIVWQVYYDSIISTKSLKGKGASHLV